MADNLQRRPPPPRLNFSAPGASPQEAAAIAAALERFLAETALAPSKPGLSRWQRAALLEGVERAPEPAPWALGR